MLINIIKEDLGRPCSAVGIGREILEMPYV